MENSIVFFCNFLLSHSGKVGGKMNFKQFCEKLYKAISEFYGEEVKLEIKDVTKNNGVKLTGLLITEDGKNVSPSIYLNNYFHDYESGKEIDRIIVEIITLYEKVRKNPKVDMDFFKDYNSVKERICYKVINYAKNEEFLKECPHIKYLNLAIVFYYPYSNCSLGKGTIAIRNSHKEDWKVSTDELYRQATENTKRLFPYEILGTEDLLKEFVEEEFVDENMQLSREMRVPMYVVTNNIRHFGAAGIMYPGLLHQLAKKEDANLFLLPSSVHEIIVLPDIGQDAEDLQTMVREVNETQVADEEILSDSVYYYDKFSEKIEVLI